MDTHTTKYYLLINTVCKIVQKDSNWEGGGVFQGHTGTQTFETLRLFSSRVDLKQVWYDVETFSCA